MRLHGILVQFLGFVVLLLCAAAHAADEADTRLLRQPAISKDHLAFVYGGDIWISDRDGSHAIRITAHPASEFAPHFSPDGR
jgi:tricorn protease